MMAVKEYKESQALGLLGGKFYDFLCEYMQFTDAYPKEHIARVLAPWFNTPDEEMTEFEADTHSQFYAEFVQQKYRLALEFCAQEAGFKNVILCDPDILVPISGGLFWFKDCHPQPVRWIMQVEGSIVARGLEEANTLNKSTLEDWLLGRIVLFTKVKNKEQLDVGRVEETGS